MDYELTDSRVIFTGRVFKLRQDTVQYPNGRQVQLDIVEHNGAVVMLPVDSEDNIWFIRQYRHAAGREMLELPAGMLETDELPLQAAEREIREETGMSSGELTHLGGFFLAPGYSTEYLHIFLARQLEPGPLEPDDDEVITVERIPVVEAYRMAEHGEISDAKSLASLMLARPWLLGVG